MSNPYAWERDYSTWYPAYYSGQVDEGEQPAVGDDSYEFAKLDTWEYGGGAGAINLCEVDGDIVLLQQVGRRLVPFGAHALGIKAQRADVVAKASISSARPRPSRMRGQPAPMPGRRRTRRKRPSWRNCGPEISSRAPGSVFCAFSRHGPAWR